MEVATGKMRGGRQLPDVRPQRPRARPKQARSGNYAFNDAFEPGSTGKLMTMSAALEQKVIRPTPASSCPTGCLAPARSFKDNEPHGVENMTATGVLAKSSNMGTMLIG